MSEANTRIRPRLASIIFLLGVILLPYGYQETVGLGSANYIVRWPLWIYKDSFYDTGFSLIAVGEMISFVPYWALRFLPVYWIFRYYSRISDRRQMLSIGLLAEVPSLVLSLIAFIQEITQPNGFSMFILPIPTLLTLTIVFVYLMPHHADQNHWPS